MMEGSRRSCVDPSLALQYDSCDECPKNPCDAQVEEDAKTPTTAELLTVLGVRVGRLEAIVGRMLAAGTETPGVSL